MNGTFSVAPPGAASMIRETTMTRLLFAGFFAISLLSPTDAQAQAATPQPAAKPVDKQAMYEDIEVMRRILNGQLGHVRIASHDLAILANWITDNSCTTCHQATADFLPNLESNILDPSVYSQWTRLLNARAHAVDDSSTNAVTTWLNAYHDPAFHPATRQHLWWRKARATRGPAIEFEGAYLKGHGVAYTASVSQADAASLPTPTKSSAILSTCGKCHDPE